MVLTTSSKLVIPLNTVDGVIIAKVSYPMYITTYLYVVPRDLNSTTACKVWDAES
ncbi:MAG: hypothetical protein QXG46_03040 [Ignisphaera sp.]